MSMDVPHEEERVWGTLYVVATPLGNVDDLSVRAREVLASADAVLAEDTRRAGMLCRMLGIEARGFVSLHEHNEERRIARVLEELGQGRNLALVSDAGTPLVSDPGYRVVRACREAGARVAPVPGPSAVPTALCACGLPPYPFVFLGFLPHKTADIRRTLQLYGGPEAPRATLVFFERKNRVRATLQAAAEVLGTREFCIARELTKVHEEFILGRLDELDRLPDELLGEVTIVVAPPDKDEAAPRETALAVLREELEAGGKPRAVAKRAAGRVRGWSVGELYELVGEAKGDA